MKTALAGAYAAVRERKGIFLGSLAAFVALYYAILFGTMLVRFGEVPNYVTLYNWPANVWRIFVSTPSLIDALEIARQEWLLEIGYMNYDFGHGISEWSVTVWPTKLVLLLLAGALVSTCAVLTFPGSRAACSAPARRAALAAGGGGAALVGLSTATLSWVVCCATPSWVVTLSLLGMSPSLALMMEPLGTPMIFGGYAMLAAAVLWLAHRRATAGGGGDAHAMRLKPSLYSGG